MFVNNAVRGKIRDKDSKWVLDEKKNALVGAFAFESAHGIANLMQIDMEQSAGRGMPIGGDANTSFTIKADGVELKVGSQKGFGKYGVPQSQVLQAIYESFKLPAVYIVWTAGLNMDKDEITTSKVVGPDVIGRALTGVLPKDFNYTFRLGVNPARDGKAEEHVLYLGTHVDTQAGGAIAMGNIRRPLDAPPLKEQVIKPADLPKALKLIKEDGKKAAIDIIKKRMEARAKLGVKAQVP